MREAAHEDLLALAVGRGRRRRVVGPRGLLRVAAVAQEGRDHGEEALDGVDGVEGLARG